MKNVKEWLKSRMAKAKRKRTRQRGLELYDRFHVVERLGYIYLLVDGVAVERFKNNSDTAGIVVDEIERARQTALFYEGLGMKVIKGKEEDIEWS